MGLRAAVPVSAPLPTIDAIIEGKTDVAPTIEETKAPEPKEDQGSLERIEREQKHRRELFAAQKRIKELEAKSGNPSNQTSGLDSKNPIKDLAKSKGLSQDEVVRMALEAMDDDLSPQEKKDDLKGMTPEAIAAMVLEQIEAKNQKKEEAVKETQAVTDFKTKISNEAAEKFPIVAALGGAGSAFDIINEQFKKDAEEFGLEYAQENMISIEHALKKTNEALAINIKDALKSKELRDFISNIIKEDGAKDKKAQQSNVPEQLEDEEESITMTNLSHRAATEAGGRPKFNSDQEELDFLINKY